MANRNIPGSGPINNSAKQVVGGNPAGEGALAPLPDIQDALSKGSITKAKEGIDALGRSLGRYTDDQLKMSRQEGSEYKVQIQSLKEKVKLSEMDIKQSQRQLTFMYKHKDVFKQTIDLVKTRVALEKDSQKQAQAEIRRAQEGVRLEGMKRVQQRVSFQQFRDQSRQTLTELQKVEQAKQRGFGAHLVKSGFNPLNAARRYGHQQMELNKPSFLGGEAGADIGEFAGGAAAAAGGFVLSKLLGVVTNAILHNLQNSYTIGDVYKGSGSLSPLKDFKGNIHETMLGYGTSADEEAQMARSIRPTVGAVGNFEEIMRQGTAQDRSFGSDLGTGATFLSSMIRKGDVGSDDNSLNKISTAFAEALGRGKMVGLQEELVGGMTQLVEITRRSSPSGAPNAGMFAGMMADLSSIGTKSLKGSDAANVIAGLDSGLKNPQNAFASVIGPMAIRSVLTKLATNGQIDPSMLQDNGTILSLQAQGMAAQVRGKDGNMISLGQKLMPEMLKQAIGMGGGDGAMTKLAMSNSFGIPFGQMSTMIDNQKFLSSNPGAKFSESFGIGNVDHFNTGTAGFIKELSSIFSTQTNGGKTEMSDAAKGMYVSEALERFKETLSDSDKKSLEEDLTPKLKGKGANEQVSAILDYVKDIKEGAPTDQVRSDVADILKITQKMADAVVDNIAPAVLRIANVLTPDTQKKEMEDRIKKGELPGGKRTADERDTDKVEGLKAKAAVEEAIAGHPLPEYHTQDFLKQVNPASGGINTTDDIKANKAYLEEAAKKAGVDPKLASFIAGQETGGGYNNFDKKGNVLTNPDSGAMGIMQLMPDTAKLYGVDPKNTHQVIDAGIKELKKDLDKRGGKVDQALIDYDGGGIHLKNGTPLKPETIKYLLAAQRAGVLPDDYKIPDLYTTGAQNAPEVPQTRGQQTDSTQRVGVDQNMTLTVQTPNGQMVSQDSASYSHQITTGQTAPSTAYKKSVIVGPTLP